MGLAACAAPPELREAPAAVPPVEYRSAFAGYKPFAEQDLADWRKANEEVGAAAGHKGHR